MNRAHRALSSLLVVALVTLAGGALADEHIDEDPFADDPGLFENDTEEDPFAELEERANVSDDDAEDEQASAEGDESTDGEDEDAIPLGVWAVVAGLGLAAWGARTTER